jgi:Zn-dependent peptidase ImmA (M78 family)
MIEASLAEKICSDYKVPEEACEKYGNFYRKSVLARVQKKYLSHLVSSVEDMINEKLRKDLDEKVRHGKGTQQDIDKYIKNNRRFSILISPVAELKRKAVSYVSKHGATILYNTRFVEGDVRVLLAHELGHLVSGMLMDGAGADTENHANVFAFFALQDKNNFYKNTAKDFLFQSDTAIAGKIAALCPITMYDQASDVKKLSDGVAAT